MRNLDFLSADYSEQKKKADKKVQPVLVIFFSIAIAISCIAIYFFISKNNTFSRFSDYVSDFPTIALVVITIPMYFIYKAYTKGEFNFWYSFAEKNNGLYEPFGFPEREQSVMFRQGYSQAIEHVIIFKNEEEEVMRLFSFSFTKNGAFQKNPSHYHYTVFDFQFRGTVPNLYLNYKNDRYGIALDKKLSLPTEFEKRFIVSVPSGYEIEALEIFTPDLLVAILDLGIHVDIELVGHHIYFFVEQKQSFGLNFEKHLEILEQNYKAVTKLMLILQSTLKHFNFEKIGTKTPFL